jgi:hypothetical protein
MIKKGIKKNLKKKGILGALGNKVSSADNPEPYDEK